MCVVCVCVKSCDCLDGAATTAMVTSGVQRMPHTLVMLGDSPTHILERMIFEKKSSHQNVSACVRACV